MMRKNDMKIMMRTTISLLTVILLCAGCGNGNPTYTSEVINGVTYVHNHSPLWGEESRIELEYIGTIGGLETDNENYQLYIPADVAADAGGNIYVLENGGNMIKKFDRDLRFIKAIGREGQGPGEFSFPVGCEIGADGNIHVGNTGNNRIEVLSLNGDYIDSHRMFLFNSRFTRLRSGMYVVIHNQRFPDEVNDPDNSFLLKMVDTSGETVAEFGKLRKYSDNDMAFYGNMSEIASDREDNIYIAMRYQNRIEKYAPDGTLLLHISRDLPYRESEFMDDEISFASNIEVDPRGWIWVETWERQCTDEEKQIEDPADKPYIMMLEVFDENGILLTRVKPDLPNGYWMRCVTDDRIFFIDLTENMDVRIFRIIE